MYKSSPLNFNSHSTPCCRTT